MYRNILVPVDLDRPKSSTEALTTAISLAKHFSSNVTVCSVVSNARAIETGEWLPISIEQQLFDTRSRLEGFVAQLDGDQRCEVEIGSGTISGGILEIAKRIGADLIVVGSHQPGPRDYLLAANAIRVARRAPCSVLVARHGSA